MLRLDSLPAGSLAIDLGEQPPRCHFCAAIQSFDSRIAAESSELAILDCITTGAAPGSWTEFLAQQCHVFAVDPAALDDVVAALPDVEHIRRTSQTAGDELAECLGNARAAVLSCDVNKHPYEVVPSALAATICIPTARLH